MCLVVLECSLDCGNDGRCLNTKIPSMPEICACSDGMYTNGTCPDVVDTPEANITSMNLHGIMSYNNVEKSIWRRMFLFCPTSSPSRSSLWTFILRGCWRLYYYWFNIWMHLSWWRHCWSLQFKYSNWHRSVFSDGTITISLVKFIWFSILL